MKKVRFSAAAVVLLTTLVWLLGTPPARADQAGFSLDKGAYQAASTEFDKRVRSVLQLETSPGGLKAWVDQLAKLGKDLNDSSDAMRIRLKGEAAATFNQIGSGSTKCMSDWVGLLGPFSSGFGYAALSHDYERALSDLYESRKRLGSDQDKVSAKLADALLHGRPTTDLNDLLSALKNARAATDGLYSSMIARANTMASERRIYENALYGPECDPSQRQTPNPAIAASPSAAPKPISTLTPTSAPAPGPGGAERWNGTYVDAGGTLRCEFKGAGSAVRITCTTTYGGTIIEDESLSCQLTKPLHAECTSTGHWKEASYDANFDGRASIDFIPAHQGLSDSTSGTWDITRTATRWAVSARQPTLDPLHRGFYLQRKQ